MSWFSARQESKEREIEANKNFKTNTGASRKELVDRDGRKDARDSFTTEELERHTRLEKKQVENIQDTSTKKETKAELEETRQNKKSWW